MGMYYRIGEFAELGGVSAKTLRFYDEIGLLRPAGVDPRTRYRRYVPQQLEELASIVALRELGASLADIQKLRNSHSKARRHELLNELKSSTEQSIEIATKFLSWVNAELNQLQVAEDPIPVIVKRRPSVLIASIRSTVKNYAEIARFEQELITALPTEAVGDLRGVLWHRCADSGYPEGEPFVAVKPGVARHGGIELKQLPPATLACAYSKSDDKSAEQTYCAIRRWMEIRGFRLAGPKREIYLDPLLEIQFPLESA